MRIEYYGLCPLNAYTRYRLTYSFTADIDTVSAGSNGLIFTPYIAGERTPHVEANIRGSFIGIDSIHERRHFVRTLLEGITFSLNESVKIFRESGKTIDTIVSIGGGAKNATWLQMQADIFNAKIIKMKSEQGSGMGAAIIAANGCGWFNSIKDCAEQFLNEADVYEPIPANVEKYEELFAIYQDVYTKTKVLNNQLMSFRD